MNPRFLANGMSNYVKREPTKILDYGMKIADIYTDQLHFDTITNTIKIRNVIAAVCCVSMIVHNLNIVPKTLTNIDLVKETINMVIEDKVKFSNRFPSVDKVIKFIEEQGESLLEPAFITLAVTTFNADSFYESLIEAHDFYETEK